MKLNSIYCGDCQRVLGNTIEFPNESVDLIYADPPFFSNKQYEIIWKDGYEMRSFEDRWKGGVENYITWMEPKLRECHRILKQTGSMYLHCDWHADAHLRILMDQIFGPSNFRNEIIWHYKKWSAGFKQFQRNHDVILFYSKSKFENRVFNMSFQDRAESTLKRFGNSKIISGYDENTGERLPSQMAEEDSIGVPLDDVWDIGRVPPIKQLYPTQKPESLLERIIFSSTNEGDLILDPFCGCGTTVRVAHRMKRNWIGIDVSPTACKLITSELRQKLKVRIGKDHIIGLPRTKNEILSMEPFEFQNWVIDKLMARPSIRKTGDMGIDGYLIDNSPIQVKQSEDVGRNVVDNFETAIRRAGKSKGTIVAISFGKGAYEEVARVKNQEGLDITLMTLAQLIDME
jgi:DNA modification methylase